MVRSVMVRGDSGEKCNGNNFFPVDRGQRGISGQQNSHTIYKNPQLLSTGGTLPSTGVETNRVCLAASSYSRHAMASGRFYPVFEILYAFLLAIDVDSLINDIDSNHIFEHLGKHISFRWKTPVYFKKAILTNTLQFHTNCVNET